MTKDEFIAMVKKAGITVRLSINYDTNGYWQFEGEDEDLERFAALVAEIVRADEREACERHFQVAIRNAVIAEREAMATEAAKQGWAMKNEDPFEDAVREIAAIRARGEASIRSNT